MQTMILCSRVPKLWCRKADAVYHSYMTLGMAADVSIGNRLCGFVYRMPVGYVWCPLAPFGRDSSLT
jgi:hypothetical protein